MLRRRLVISFVTIILIIVCGVLGACSNTPKTNEPKEDNKDIIYPQDGDKETDKDKEPPKDDGKKDGDDGNVDEQGENDGKDDGKDDQVPQEKEYLITFIVDSNVFEEKKIKKGDLISIPRVEKEDFQFLYFKDSVTNEKLSAGSTFVWETDKTFVAVFDTTWSVGF